MKRSKNISLVLMTSMSALVLAGCEPTTDKVDNGGTFTTMAECVAQYDQETCATANKEAQSEHLKNAPHFSSKQACIEQYGADACLPASTYGGSSNVFMPMMLGYMMGSMTSRPAPLYYGPGEYRHAKDHDYRANVYSSGTNYRKSGPIGSSSFSNPFSKTSKGTLKSGTAITSRGGFGMSFKPTKSFTTSYAKSNPSSFGRSSYSSSSSYSRSSSISSRGGFGSSARGFSGSYGG